MASRGYEVRILRRAKLAGAVGGILLLAQMATYWLSAERAMPVAALRQLHDYRWLKRSRFALFPQNRWDALTPSQREAVARELKRHVTVIYHSAKEIPQASLHTQPITEKDTQSYERAKGARWVKAETLEALREEIESGRKVIGYNDGVRLEWELCRRGPFWMQSRAGVWVSVIGAEWREDVYVWLLGWWVRVWNLAHPVA